MGKTVKFSTNSDRQLDVTNKRVKLALYLTPYTKISSKFS
jgi:hypothetical protein